MLKRLQLPIMTVLSIAIVGLLISSASSNKQKLLLLNWGEYINEDLVVRFEEENNCEVVISYADSNELFYQKVQSGTTVYDLVIPSEYMVEKMYRNDLIQEIDLSRLKNYDSSKFLPGLANIQNQLFINNEKYMVPYFWGTFGLMYNKRVQGLEEAVLKESWATIFDSTKRPSSTRTGMYNIPRFAYAAALFYALEQQEKGLNYLGLEIGPNYDDDQNFNLAKEILSQASFKEWGTDTLKHNIGSNNLDLAFCYTGDFFDVLYSKIEDNPNYLDQPEIGIHVPSHTIAFIDSFVITKKARHLDLAYKFIDYFLDPEIAYENASIIGYCTPLIESYNMIINGDDETWSKVVTEYPYNPVPIGSDIHVGIPLVDLNSKFLTQLTLMIDNIKVGK